MEEPRVGAASENNPAVSHELSDVNVRGVLYFALWLTVVAIVIHIAIWLLYEYFAARQKGPLTIPHQPAATPVAKPQLQVQPESELSQLRSSEEQILRNYGWIDREKGIVRIPIERAMDIIAAEKAVQKEAKQRQDQRRVRKSQTKIEKQYETIPPELEP